LTGYCFSKGIVKSEDDVLADDFGRVFEVERYLYLSMIPESLVVSMLPPVEFGVYLATGTVKRPHGQAMYFRLKDDFRNDYFDFSHIEQRCVPHPDGTPKHSVYLGIYRVLEHVPIEAIDNLYLATAHGQVLEIERGQIPAEFSGTYHLYQEICPVHPLIASRLNPIEFCRWVTDTSKPISVPRICFVELDLAGLADDPLNGSAENLPYPNIDHLRNCLDELKRGKGKDTKTVDRVWRQSFLYRCVKGGFILGDSNSIAYYPYPTQEEMESKYYAWWRCANDGELQHIC